MALALASFRGENSRFPERLNELVPKYIAELPKDRFADVDYVYRQEGKGYILYSVGYNGKDDGGMEQGEDSPGDDFVIRTPKETKEKH